MNIHSLYCGTYSVGLDKIFYPIDRDAQAEKGALKLSIHSFLIRTEHRTILIDPGLGPFSADQAGNRLLEELALHGLEDHDITDIICSHLHYDHIGGLVKNTHGYLELQFPEAVIWASRKEWEKVSSKSVYYDDEKTAFIAFLQAKASLHLVEQDQTLFDGIAVEHLGGHTEFSLLIRGDLGEDAFLMAGDVLANASHVNRKFTAKYDFDPKGAAELREKIARRAFEENRWILAFHSNHEAIFRLASPNDQGYTLIYPSKRMITV